MKSRDPNRSIPTRVTDVSSADDVVAELPIVDDGTTETVNPTHVFPTDGAN